MKQSVTSVDISFFHCQSPGLGRADNQLSSSTPDSCVRLEGLFEAPGTMQALVRLGPRDQVSPIHPGGLREMGKKRGKWASEA